jgi:hypothetical protein
MQPFHGAGAWTAACAGVLFAHTHKAQPSRSTAGTKERRKYALTVGGYRLLRRLTSPLHSAGRELLFKFCLHNAKTARAVSARKKIREGDVRIWEKQTTGKL